MTDTAGRWFPGLATQTWQQHPASRGESPSRCWELSSASGCSLCSLPTKALSQGSSDSHILDLSNRFYTLIPHDFGMKKPPLLNNADSVQVAPRSRGGHGSGLCGVGCHSLITAPLCCDPRGQRPGLEAHRWALISK